MDEITNSTQEQKLIVCIFELIAKLGYAGEEKYDKVSIVDLGIFRLMVGEIKTEQALAVLEVLNFPNNLKTLETAD